MGLIGYLVYKLRNPYGTNKKASLIDYEKFSIKQVTEFIKQSINEMTNSDIYDKALDQEDYERIMNNRAELKSAQKGCATGNIYDKIYVKDFIFDRLLKYYDFTDQTINLVIPFDEPDKLTVQDKFDILMHCFKKEHGYDALGTMIKKYDLDRLKKIIEDGTTKSYIIIEDEIHEIYRLEIVTPLSFEDKLHVIAQRVYQGYKGLGVIDEIRDMRIDGVSGGVSGQIREINDIDDEMNFYKQLASSKMGLNSVWIMYKGKTIHLSFLSFQTEIELKRVCQNIYKFNNPGPLNESNGFIVNDMWDGSRIVVFRPPYSESWAFWNRKFDGTYTEVEEWFDSKNAAKKIENTELPIEFLKFLMKGARVTAFTGEQGAGKTTLMMGLVKYIYAWLPIRVQEMMFELNLRNRYPERNIETVRETDTVSGQEALDSLKKTDGSANITSEVATPKQASWIVQNAGVGFLFSLFSHHAKTTRDLIYSLRNSTMQTGMFSNERTAESQIVRSIPFDAHLTKDSAGSGFRYLEHITEIIPITEQTLSSDFHEAAIELLKRMTSPDIFETKVIIGIENDRYVAINRPSETQIRDMKRFMEPEDQVEFDAFLKKHWKVSA